MTFLFIALGLVVGSFLVGGIIAFLPSATLGELEKKIGRKTGAQSSDPNKSPEK
jgi:hypothetical protein